MSKIAELTARFPDHELALRRLHNQDAEFRAICDDYEEALAALQRWRQSGEGDPRTEDYSLLALDLKTEILAILDGPRGRPPRRDTD